MKRSLCLGLALATAALGVVYWYSATSTGQAVAQKSESQVDAFSAQGIGYVEPASEVRKLMLRTGGIIRYCYAKTGDSVCKGYKLLELEDATQRAEVAVAIQNRDMALAEAEQVNSGVNPYQIKALEQAVARLQEKVRLCQTEADRSRRLMSSRSTSSQDHEELASKHRQAEAELGEKKADLIYLNKHVTPEQRAVAEAKVQLAQAALKLAEEKVREAELRAPFDGVVLKWLKREGEGVRTFEPEPVLLFGDLSRLRVRAEIDERFVASLAVGQSASVYGRNLAGKTYQGTVVSVEPIMGDKTVFARMSSERKDLNVIQVLVELGPEFRAPTGLQVDVRIEWQN